ncbi:protein of unknown function (plasmid) [Azospirillum baldaniorum]|uniref:Uncharacterized protein n=1 Tax=Azospirillum baldaniorum TaxID=1064539 RepID=A0A9P1JZS2_9PROT|nr:protein of unknown function [Azospirillum baldaniorum]
MLGNLYGPVLGEAVGPMDYRRLRNPHARGKIPHRHPGSPQGCSQDGVAWIRGAGLRSNRVRYVLRKRAPDPQAASKRHKRLLRTKPFAMNTMLRKSLMKEPFRDPAPRRCGDDGQGVRAPTEKRRDATARVNRASDFDRPSHPVRLLDLDEIDTRRLHHASLPKTSGRRSFFDTPVTASTSAAYCGGSFPDLFSQYQT